ncbi:MAG: GntR family transcriptional regulator [Candidatus Neomarinimicrobiota bacterium]
MEFGINQAIYLQIVDYLCETILAGKWKEGEKIPAIREMAVNLEVNPNTVMRSYAYLQERNIIYNQRGIGFFVAEGGLAGTRRIKHADFVQNTLPRLFKIMDLLEIGFEELNQLYNQFKTKGSL